MFDGLSFHLRDPNPFQPTGIEFEWNEKAIGTNNKFDSSGKALDTLIKHQHRSPKNYVVRFHPGTQRYGLYSHRYTAKMSGWNSVERNRMN